MGAVASRIRRYRQQFKDLIVGKFSVVIIMTPMNEITNKKINHCSRVYYMNI